ncbi:zinc finger protein 346 isoform X2 [Erinaceus europaeus]|uniref:Zinc finger protein 346 n=1 Tax=Erinaceus europaeus TaxID=9365 RepID=A0ABM3XWK4_ERIEU|nr:zinc finger protein 346 isoform X2 [Erinaceus europaeus]
MECAAVGAAVDAMEAADHGGGALPCFSSEEPESREPDGLRFDREGARRLWEAVSGAQPMGREEVEHMIQKNQCLFTNTQCKVCCAMLISESQKLAHYQSKKHANKVKRYLSIRGMETLKGEMKKLDSDQKSSRSKEKNQCCPICNMTFSSPAVAQSHYLGKTHAKSLKLKQQSTKVEGSHGKRWRKASSTPKKLPSKDPPSLPEELEAQDESQDEAEDESEDESEWPNSPWSNLDPSQSRKTFPSQSLITCPITWGSVKRLVGDATTLLEEGYKPHTPENMIMAFMTQVAINSEKKQFYDSSTTSS